MNGAPTRDPLTGLLDKRRREYLAKYLSCHPLLAQHYIERRRKQAGDESIPDYERKMAADLVAFLEGRLVELKQAAGKAYRKHLRRRAELLGERNAGS